MEAAAPDILFLFIAVVGLVSVCEKKTSLAVSHWWSLLHNFPAIRFEFAKAKKDCSKSYQGYCWLAHLQGNTVMDVPYSLDVQNTQPISTYVDTSTSLLELATGTPIHNVTVRGNIIINPKVPVLFRTFLNEHAPWSKLLITLFELVEARDIVGHLSVSCFQKLIICRLLELALCLLLEQLSQITPSSTQ